MWHELKTNPPKPDKYHSKELLCAWEFTTKPGHFTYDVLVLWPDGVWTDTTEDPVEKTDCMPAYWRSIQPPVTHQK